MMMYNTFSALGRIILFRYTYSVQPILYAINSLYVYICTPYNTIYLTAEVVKIAALQTIVLLLLFNIFYYDSADSATS